MSKGRMCQNDFGAAGYRTRDLLVGKLGRVLRFEPMLLWVLSCVSQNEAVQ